MAATNGQPLTQKTAVVTGASGGIGGSIALHLARAGAQVILHTWQRTDVAEQLAGRIRAEGGQADIQVADLSKTKEHESLVEECWQRYGSVDIWVNNAGADVLTGDASRQSFEQRLERLWQVDVLGTLRLSRLAGQRMQPRGGVIVNVGWDQAETGMAGDSGEMFAATKGAIMAFTRSLAKSLAPNVRVNCVAPGWIQTEWGSDASPYWDQRAQQEALRDRWGRPDDVARAVLFLVSPAADFVNAEILHVNGGLAGYEQWAPAPVTRPDTTDTAPGRAAEE